MRRLKQASREEEFTILAPLDASSSLHKYPDGTGWLRLNNDGTVGPTIPFNHNFTEANGYTIYSSIPFFSNNWTQVDLNSIDWTKTAAKKEKKNV